MFITGARREVECSGPRLSDVALRADGVIERDHAFGADSRLTNSLTVA